MWLSTDLLKKLKIHNIPYLPSVRPFLSPLSYTYHIMSDVAART